MASTRVVITKLEQTCFACPSQWDGMTEDGRSVYIRFRFGHFSASVGSDDEAAVLPSSANDGQYLCAEQVGGPLDGVMSTEQMMERLEATGVVFRGPLSGSDEPR